MPMPCLSILSPALSFYHHLNFHHLHANLGRYKCQNYPVTAVWIGELWRLVSPMGFCKYIWPTPHDELFSFKVQNYASHMFVQKNLKITATSLSLTKQIFCYIILLIYTSPLNIPTAHFSLSGSTLILFIYSRNKKTEKRGGEWRLGSDRK